MTYRDFQKLLFALSIGIAVILIAQPLHPAYCSAIGFFLYQVVDFIIDEIDYRKKKKVKVKTTR